MIAPQHVAYMIAPQHVAYMLVDFWSDWVTQYSIILNYSKRPGNPDSFLMHFLMHTGRTLMYQQSNVMIHTICLITFIIQHISSHAK